MHDYIEYFVGVFQYGNVCDVAEVIHDDGVLGDFALEDLDNSAEFRTLAYLDYEEMRGYMYGMLESYRHYKPLIMGAIHA